MRFLVLGAGALGGYFGGRLLRGGADVTFVVRPARAAQLRRDGLVVRSQDGEIRTQVRTIQQGQVDGNYDVVLLCCKAYDLTGAISAIAPAMGDQSVVLPLLNGMRHIDVLTETFGAPRVLGGLTFINAALTSDGTIQQSQVRFNITAIGELDGRASPRCAAIKMALEAGGIPVQVSDDIVAMMWTKFFGFACNATITSLTRSRAGAIARSGAGVSLVSAVIEECTRVATAEGYPPPSDWADTIRGMFSQPDSTYGPSLLVDMEEGRRTEGEHTIGDLVERAARHGVGAPILGAALCNLQAYEIMSNQRRL
jgi:2-dehydropantoate 2-reductase